ncbi:MAG: glycosyltransferase family 4 protein [Deltaproteobacteria bacterium]|nr:glycosyltransferase family 4 protein [Deltaproteobacteria bacterium]
MSALSPVRIVHVDTGRTWRGGQRQVWLLHRGLVERGVASLLLCTAGGELHRRTEATGLPVRGLPLRGEWDLASAVRIAREARRAGATHLHLHSAHAQTLGLLASRFAGMRRVLATRRVDFVPRDRLVNRWKYGSGISRFVAISAAIRDILVRFGVPAERIRLVPSGVDFTPPPEGGGAAVRRELSVAPGQPLVGTIGALVDHKGQRYLVEAAALVLRERPEARFAIVGEGELRADLEARAEVLGLGDRLLFTGFRRDVPAVLDALDLFVLPSHLEGLGTIVLDALAAGKPVVGTRAGGIPEMIEDGRHGLLVPPRDPPALAAAVLRLLGDPELGRRLAAEGRTRALGSFSADAMVEGNLAVYRELTA